MLVHSMLPMENDGEYTVVFWAKVDGREGQSRQIRVHIDTAYVEDIILDSTDWKEYSLTFHATGVEGGVPLAWGSLTAQQISGLMISDFSRALRLRKSLQARISWQVT